METDPLHRLKSLETALGMMRDVSISPRATQEARQKAADRINQIELEIKRVKGMVEGLTL